MTEDEEIFKKNILEFIRYANVLRIKGFISDGEFPKVQNRIYKYLNRNGYRIDTVGFYEYEITKIKEKDETTTS